MKDTQPKFQVVEKTDFGTAWQQVRYEAYAIERFDIEKKALDAAKQYLTDVNCNNALAKEEKLNAAEAFMMTDKGCLLGVLDREDWYMTYPKDISKKVNGEMQVVYQKGAPVKDAKYFMLEGKTEVAVRQVPGT